MSKNKIGLLSHNANFDPKGLMVCVMEQYGDEIKDIVIVVQTKEGKKSVHMSTLDTGFISLASVLLQREVFDIVKDQ